MIFVLMIQRTGFGNSDGSDIRGDFQELAVQAVCRGHFPVSGRRCKIELKSRFTPEISNRPR
jgi:hypothetical protein